MASIASLAALSDLMPCIRDDRNNLTLLWGLASGKRRSCFFAFLTAKQGCRGAGHSAVRTPCSLYVSKLSSQIAHSLPRKLRAGGHKVARHLPSKVFLSFGVSWYLRKHNLCQESNVYWGLQAMTDLGWIEATSSWLLHSNPEEKNTLLEDVIGLLVQFLRFTISTV